MSVGGVNKNAVNVTAKARPKGRQAHQNTALCPHPPSSDSFPKSRRLRKGKVLNWDIRAAMTVRADTHERGPAELLQKVARVKGSARSNQGKILKGIRGNAASTVINNFKM